MNAGRPFPGALRRRVALAFVAVAGVSAGALAIGADLIVHSTRTQSFADRARREVQANLRLLAAGAPIEVLAARLVDTEKPGGPALIVVKGDAVVRSIATVDLDDVPADVREAARSRADTIVERTVGLPSGSTLLIGTVDADDGVELYSFFPREELLRGLADLRRTLAIGWAVVAAAAGIVGSLVARRTLRPVRDAAAAAHAVTEGLLETRLPVRSGDEFGAWAAAFNDMVEALEQKITALADARDREHRLTADIAHELRTPLGAVLTAASHLETTAGSLPADARDATEIIIEASRRLDRLTNELLELHRLDAGQESVRLELVNLGAAVGAAIRAHGWTERVRAEILADAVVETDRHRLDRILVNLIANGVQHGGGEVVVTVDFGPPASITVRDAGPGIAPEHLDLIFDRYFKGHADRRIIGAGTGTGGSGLGLAIVRDSAALIGAHVEVTSALREGTAFSLVFARGSS